jgi:Ni,Fe-hydrogenase maturation factor
MTRKLLIAGVGSISLGDDGFGVEVASRLAAARSDDHQLTTKEWAYVPRDSW